MLVKMNRSFLDKFYINCSSFNCSLLLTAKYFDVLNLKTLK